MSFHLIHKHFAPESFHTLPNQVSDRIQSRVDFEDFQGHVKDVVSLAKSSIAKPLPSFGSSGPKSAGTSCLLVYACCVTPKLLPSDVQWSWQCLTETISSCLGCWDRLANESKAINVLMANLVFHDLGPNGFFSTFAALPHQMSWTWPT